MVLIAHRGNIDGKNNKENLPEHINDALNKGYNAEIDLRYICGKLYLGHDEPEYEINYSYLLTPNLWIHCKNIDALEYLKDFNNPNNYFWHQEDDVTLTSSGFLWTYPNKPLTKYSIAVIKGSEIPKNLNCFGVCSDFVSNF